MADGVPTHALAERFLPASAPARPNLATVARHPISRAAEVTGLHPQTLRYYERRGVIRATRTEGGKRLFSDAELERARRVRALTDEAVPLLTARRITRLEDLLELALGRIRTLEDQNRRLSDRLARLELTRRASGPR